MELVYLVLLLAESLGVFDLCSVYVGVFGVLHMQAAGVFFLWMALGCYW